ncbi:PREDICTED: solute carrier family 2, facilitated glucose transporter member 8-like [Papilio polytes]|uniref:solute carrier family 2, facilitated glucose transporter member 8-like n=1 Tax=Papilio polytes TaxID=76194 RepID=UPI00067669EF|nr:PREDICTED: solute carrier family 2, facilitated glucose transporter member 8-like [Papilio polytes]
MFGCIKSPIIRQYAVVILVNVSIFSTGMNLVWSSPMLVKLGNETETSLSHVINENEGSWIVSVEFIFAFIFNAIVALLLDSIGRKYCVVMGCVPKIIGVTIYILATEVWMLIVARLMFGLSDSFILMSVPVYTSEIATVSYSNVFS